MGKKVPITYNHFTFFFIAINLIKLTKAYTIKGSIEKNIKLNKQSIIYIPWVLL